MINADSIMTTCTELQYRADITLMENTIHHVFLGLYCTKESSIIDNVEGVFNDMGLDQLDIRVNEIKERAKWDSQNSTMVKGFMDNYNPIFTFQGIRLMREYAEKLKRESEELC